MTEVRGIKRDRGIVTLGLFRDNFNLLCENLREIFHSNYSFIALAFILIYTLQQGLLLFFSIKLSPELALGVGLFMLATLTTIAIERLLLESRTKRISELSTDNLYLNKSYKERVEILEKQNKSLIEYISNLKK